MFQKFFVHRSLLLVRLVVPALGMLAGPAVEAATVGNGPIPSHPHGSTPGVVPQTSAAELLVGGLAVFGVMQLIRHYLSDRDQGKRPK